MPGDERRPLPARVEPLPTPAPFRIALHPRLPAWAPQAHPRSEPTRGLPGQAHINVTGTILRRRFSA